MELDVKEQLDEVLSRYSKERSNLIPILQEAQERFRYLPQEVMEQVARFLQLPPSTVFGVSTFYAHFRLTPPGKNTVKVCLGPACHLRGSAVICDEVEKRLGIKPRETTGDLKYSLETTACSGACALAPVVEINDKVYSQMTRAKARRVLAK